MNIVWRVTVMLMEFQCFNKMNVRINLNPGIYRFGNESASGKTYMYKLLTSLSNRKDILGVSASNYHVFKNSIEELINNFNVQLVIFDRYDMYSEYFEDVMLKYSSEIVFLIDCKRSCSIRRNTKRCYIELYRDKIEVWDYGAV